MLREPYSTKSYTYHSNYIDNRLSLRPPQKESLERFARIVDILSLSKTPDLDAELANIRELFPTGLSIGMLRPCYRHRKNTVDGCNDCLFAL